MSTAIKIRRTDFHCILDKDQWANDAVETFADHLEDILGQLDGTLGTICNMHELPEQEGLDLKFNHAEEEKTLPAIVRKALIEYTKRRAA